MKGAKDMQNLTITAGAPAASAKRILKSARAERVNRKYLAVLLEIQQNSEFRAFLREHDVKSVQHGANDKYYSALLSREPQRLLRTDFEMDVAGEDRNIQDAEVVAATSAAQRGEASSNCLIRLFGNVFPSSITKGGIAGRLCSALACSSEAEWSESVLRTYSGNYKTEEDRLALIRRMKYFIIKGFEHDCSTHEKHQQLKRRIASMSLGEIPDTDVLDHSVPDVNRPPTDNEHLPATKPARKRSVPKPKPKAKGEAKRAKTGRGRGGRGSSRASPRSTRRCTRPRASSQRSARPRRWRSMVCQRL